MKIVKFIFKFIVKNHESIIRYLIGQYLPGYHLHKNPPSKQAERIINLGE